MRIAFGSDHRGGRIAHAILTGVLFPENGNNPEAIERLGGFFSNNGSPSFVGALIINTQVFGPNPSFANDVENILPLPDSSYSGNDDSSPLFQVDYPDIAEAVAKKVSSGEADCDILVCATGIGMCVVANKFRGIRAAACSNVQTCELSRKHNNANILCIPGEIVGAPVAVAMVKTWLDTKYEGGRHQERLNKIALIENETGL